MEISNVNGINLGLLSSSRGLLRKSRWLRELQLNGFLHGWKCLERVHSNVIDACRQGMSCDSVSHMWIAAIAAFLAKRWNITLARSQRCLSVHSAQTWEDQRLTGWEVRRATLQHVGDVAVV